MVRLKDKIEAEYENIDKLLSELSSEEKLPFLQFLELAGVATLLHNFYNGIENIVKLTLKEIDIPLPESSSLHKNLLKLAESIQSVPLGVAATRYDERIFSSVGKLCSPKIRFERSQALSKNVISDKISPLSPV